MRINRYIASSSDYSRRKAEELIRDGRIKINGKTAVLSDVVKKGDEVRLDGEIIKLRKETVTLAYNKETGVECTADESNPDNIISKVAYPVRLFTVGRLDKNSEGLILLTDDGELAYRLTRAAELHEKEYEVVVNKPIDEKFIRDMSSGVEILGQITAKCKVVKTGAKSFNITLIQGLNRQIRRMAEALGYKVTSLKRIRINDLKLKDLKIKKGEYKELSKKEFELLNVD